MEALIALLLTNVTKFLNYLNINPRLQNKILTVASGLSTLYILRIARGFYRNGNYVKSFIYVGIFIILAYFIVLNFIYYFKNQKVKWDVTNFIEDIVPEDVTFDGTTPKNGKPIIQGKQLDIQLYEDSDMIIEQVIESLVNQHNITATALQEHTFELDKYTLIPYYKIRKKQLFIGSSYSDLKEVATIHVDEDADTLVPLGVFVKGGAYELDGVIYKEPYSLELRVKDLDDETIDDETATP